MTKEDERIDLSNGRWVMDYRREADPNYIKELVFSRQATLPPINSACQVSIVVPVYKEFHRGTGDLLRTLSSIEQQVGDNDTMETLLVVNNPALGADRFGDGGRADNKDFISYFDRQKSFGKWKNIHLLDFTEGELPTRHLGITRGVGNEIAANRFSTSDVGKQGIIMQLDADTFLPETFILSLRQAYEQHSLNSAFVGKMVLPDHPDYTGEDYYMAMAHEFLQHILLSSQGKRFTTSGPTISFRASLQPIISQGYMNARENEDYFIGFSLQQLGGFALLPEPRVYIADRLRKEGFDANHRAYHTNTNIIWDTIRDISLSLGHLTGISTLDSHAQPTILMVSAEELHHKVRKLSMIYGDETAGVLEQNIDHEYERALQSFPNMTNHNLLKKGAILYGLGVTFLMEGKEKIIYREKKSAR